MAMTVARYALVKPGQIHAIFNSRMSDELDLDFNPDDYPWPVAGDKLFVADGKWWESACLSWPLNKWSAYATGYKDAADIIVERATDSRRGMDTLVYPVAFLYRHYLELRLKELVIHAEQLLDKVDSLKHGHRIDILWKTVRSLLEEVWPNGSEDDLDTVESCIDEFCQLDGQSMSFRYPVTKDGAPTLPGLQQVNLQHLKQVMERTSSLLEASSGAINDFLSEKNSWYDNGF